MKVQGIPAGSFLFHFPLSCSLNNLFFDSKSWEDSSKNISHSVVDA